MSFGAGWLLFVLAAMALLGLLALGGGLKKFGRLPGDVRYGGRNTKVYFPLTSMLLLSIFVSLLLSLLGWLFG
ncbi:MAG TPA: DUF2905 domain-containing protein [Pyrinomonadaceae bacterium]|nr:DUF2905 domain-containing protein [Pyrinomonadaceae bacterium]